METDNMHIGTTDKNVPLSLLGLLCAGYVSVFLVLGFYSQPAVDDFDFAAKLFNKGFIESQISWYRGWTGRYASTALITIFVKFFNLIKDYWLVPVSLILSTSAAFSLVIYRFGNEKVLVRHAFCWGMFLTCLYLAGVPSPAETIYWLSGGVTYQAGNILFLLLVATVACLSSDVSRISVSSLRFIFACLLVVAVAGMNETIMLCEITFLMILTLICFRNRSKERFIHLSLSVIGVASSIAVLLSPGNVQRLKCFPNAHNLMFSIVSSLKKGVVDTISWSTPSLLVATMIAVPAVVSRVESIRPGFTVRKNAIGFIAIGWLMMVSLYFPSFWSMGTAPPLRTHSVIYMIFIFWWLYSATALFSISNLNYRKISGLFSIILIISFGVSLIFTGNGSIALKDLSEGQRYFAQLQRRYEIIRDAKDQGRVHVQVPALLELPWTIHVNDITGDAADWRNTPCAKYFGIDSISTARFNQTVPGRPITP